MSAETAPTATTLVDLLDQLIEPAPPPAISMTPQTGGWVVLAVLLVGLLAYAVWRYLAYRRRTAYRRAALAALDGAGQDAAEIAAVLRRTALAAYPRSEVARLSGEDWLAFLDRSAGLSGFCAGAGHALARAPYADAGPASSELRSLARQWIEKHGGGQGA